MVGARRGQQHARLSQKSAPIFIGDRHSPEPAAVYVWNAVVAGQSFVDEGVVRRQQFEDAAVLAQDAAEKELRFSPHRLAQAVFEIGEEKALRLQRSQVAQVEPLSGEVGDECVRARIREHPSHLLLEHVRIPEPSARREVNQFVVGNAAPQEERQARGQREIADAMNRSGRKIRWRRLDPEKKLRADQESPKRQLDAALESASPILVVEGEQWSYVGLVTGRLNARRATLVRIVRAHALSCVRSFGWHTRIRRRLGVSPGPRALNGPVMVTLPRNGSCTGIN